MKLRELFEAEAKHIAFCFGRMNPPTIGHKQLLDTVAGVGGDYKIFVSQTQDKKKNPLDYSTKIGFMKAMFPEYASNIVQDAGLNTVVKVATHLYEQGYRHATFVAGSDRLDDMNKLLKDYNGVEGKSHGFYKFETLDFKSSGDREDGAEGVAGISASGARAAAANGDFEAFAEATGAGQHAKKLYAAVRKGMGISEDIEEGGFLSFLKTEPPKKKWNPAKDSRVIPTNKDNDAWIKLLIDKRRRGIELTNREWHDLETWKLKQSMKEAIPLDQLRSVASPETQASKDISSRLKQSMSSKPRNFVSKNAKMGGAGAHKDKKKAEKQGDFKHKKDRMSMEDILGELSNDLLGRYKKAAGADASAADKEGDYERGNKRFKGIVKATNKEFANDAKKNK